MKHEVSKIRLMELAGLIKEAGEGGDGNLYAFPYEPGAVFEEGQYSQMTVDELRAAITEMDEDLPDGVDIYAYDYTQYKPSNFSGGARAKCIVIDLDEGGFVYSKQALDPKQLKTITLAALRTTPLYTNRGSNSLTDRGARDVKLQQFLSKMHYQINEATIAFPTWYNSFVQKLAVKLQERIDLDVDDLQFEVVDPHLMGLDATMFGDQGLRFFPTAVRSVLKNPEFAGKAMMVWDNTGRIEDKLVAKHPELEDFIYNEEMFWVYIN